MATLFSLLIRISIILELILKINTFCLIFYTFCEYFIHFMLFYALLYHIYVNFANFIIKELTFKTSTLTQTNFSILSKYFVALGLIFLSATFYNLSIIIIIL